MAFDLLLGTAVGVDADGTTRSLAIFRRPQGYYLSGDGGAGPTPPSVETLDHVAAHVAHRYRLTDVTVSRRG